MFSNLDGLALGCGLTNFFFLKFYTLK